MSKKILKTSESVLKSNKKYKKNNPEKVKYSQYRATAKSFVTKIANSYENIEDLENLKDMIEKKIKELKK